MKTIALDYETFYSPKEDYGITECGSYGYTHHEKFDPYMISVSDGEESWAGEPKDFNWDALKGATIISHNAAFDRTVYEAMVEQKMAPKVEYHDWVCSANLTAYICNRRSLADACEYLLGVKVDKGMRNYMANRTWQDAIKEGKADALLEYARLDAARCHELWTKFSPLWPDRERALSAMTIDQCTRGIQIDRRLLSRYFGLAQDAMIAIEKSMPWLERGAVATSPKAIAEQCRINGIPSPPIKSHEDGEEKFAWWEATYGPRFPWVAAISQWRVMNKFLATLNRIHAWCRPDGTMPFALKYFGAHTGRWSGDAGLNMQNLRKDPITLNPKTLLPGKGLDLDVRALFIPRPGKKMIACDLSQIEPRVLAWLCGNHKLLGEIEGGMAIYEVHARQSLGWTGGRLKDEDPALYKRAKAEVLALGYGCGPVKYVAAAMAMAGYKVDPEVAEREVAAFRAKNKKIVDLWRSLDDQFKRSVGGTFEMELPSGRSMRYPKVRRESRRYKDDETGKPVTRLVFTADVGGRHKPHYGGLLTENLVQAVSRDVFAEHLLDLQKKVGVRILFTVHDEAVLEVEDAITPRMIERVMSRTPDWLEGCPIAAEAKEMPHYLK